MFHSATLKLTGIYLTILLSIAIGFSVVVFNISSNQFNRRVEAPEQFIRRLPRVDPEELIEVLQEQAEEARNSLRNQLIVSNITIAIAGGILSYLLARKSLEPIKQAHAAQGRFVSDASHELRTPLAIMQSEIEVALRGAKLSTNGAKQLLESNLEEIAKLRKLSDALLNLTRAENVVGLSRVDANQMIEDAVQRVAKRANNKKITIENLNTEPISFMAEAVSAEECLVILLDNAIKYSPQNSKIIVKSKAQGKFVDVSVVDQGLGIKATDLEHIFDTFYRAEQSRSGQHVEGFGLGLSLAKRLMQQQDGKIFATSQAGQGSTFILRFKSP